jgi:hypothetical protein
MIRFYAVIYLFFLSACTDVNQDDIRHDLSDVVSFCPQEYSNDVFFDLSLEPNSGTVDELIEIADQSDFLVEETSFRLANFNCLELEYAADHPVFVFHTGVDEQGRYSRHIIVVQSVDGEELFIEFQRAMAPR